MKDITLETFDTDVLQYSVQTPVLVDFWASWCGPCRALGPILEKLEAEYGGQFLLAKVDSDREREISQAFGVRSIPTVILLKGGQPVDGFVGALPEGEIRKFLGKHLPPPVVPDRGTDDDTAGALLAEGDREGALEKFQQAIATDPANDAARFEYVRLLAEGGELADARMALAPVQDKISGHVTDQRFVALDLYLHAHEAAAGNLPSEAKLQAATAADPRDLASWLGLAQRRWIRGEPAAAMDALLQIIRQDRGWNDGIARRIYVAILELLSVRSKPAPQPAAAKPAGTLITSAPAPTVQQDPLVADYRRKLSMALF